MSTRPSSALALISGAGRWALAGVALALFLVLLPSQVRAQAPMDWAKAAEQAPTLRGRTWQAFGQALWGEKVEQAARRFGVPRALIFEVMRIESAGRAYEGGVALTSPAGAIGLMQVMPATYEQLRQSYGLGPDPGDPGDNIMAGAAYLRWMGNRFGYPGLLAAYNAGPQRLQAHLAGKASLPQETITYLVRLGVWPQFQTWVEQVQLGHSKSPRPQTRPGFEPMAKSQTLLVSPKDLAASMSAKPDEGLLFRLSASPPHSGQGEPWAMDQGPAPMAAPEAGPKGQALPDRPHGGG